MERSGEGKRNFKYKVVEEEEEIEDEEDDEEVEEYNLGVEDGRKKMRDLSNNRRGSSSSSMVPSCQVEGCESDLSEAKHYHRRHKVCEFHAKAASVPISGFHQRFCQQCSRSFSKTLILWSLSFSLNLNFLLRYCIFLFFCYCKWSVLSCKGFDSTTIAWFINWGVNLGPKWNIYYIIIQF